MKNLSRISFLVFMIFSMSFVGNHEKSAVDFLKALNKEQRVKAQLPFDDISKSKWHYIPSSMWVRPGIQLSELSKGQKTLLHQLLQTSLSDTGYKKTVRIIELENVLLELSGDSVMRNPEQYAVVFYGHPEKDKLWAWSFEGHHLSLNFTVLDDEISSAPRFFGANPATIPQGARKGERTLDSEEDLGFELINSLDNEQKAIAIFRQSAFNDIVSRNTAEVKPLSEVGIKYKILNENQQLIFLKLLNEYLSTLPREQASQRMSSIRNDELEELRFAWAGAIIPGEGHYYRIQGKSFLIEFDNTQLKANHIHTVWRDFDGDFGRDLIREHYKNSAHHKN